jgi:hypothetical protein
LECPELPEESPKDNRLRLNRFAEVLRRFGLVDRHGIGAKLSLANSRTLPQLRKMLAPLSDELTTGVRVEFVAKSVYVALAEVSPQTEAWRERFSKITPQLKAIQVGRKQASRYHKHVFEILKAIFDGSLTNGKKEQRINAGIQRIDIMFDNTSGVFAKIAASLDKPSPYLPFECKNYAGDLDNPEYDQLSGRLNPSIGLIGVLVFRSIADWERANKHCQTRLKDGKLLILLDDADLEKMYLSRYEGDIKGMERVILDRLRSIKLDVPAK